jgi:hypothetical protein
VICRADRKEQQSGDSAISRANINNVAFLPCSPDRKANAENVAAIYAQVSRRTFSTLGETEFFLQRAHVRLMKNVV